jgi:3-deoxy-D-manno-octulosonic-acid transferase
MPLFILYWLISPILWVSIPFLSIFNFKIRHHWLNQKSSINNVKKLFNNKNTPIIHFHAASSGEYEQLKPILTKIRGENYLILLSFFSPTIYKTECNTTLADAVCYHPFDLPWEAYTFFKAFKIKYYITTRNDIWPNHLFIAKKMGITTILINANLYRKADYKNKINKYFLKIIFSKIDLILTGSERLQNNISKIAPIKKIKVTGDSRLDQVILRKELNKKPLLPKLYKLSNNIILGSIIPSDYKIIFSSFKDFYYKGDVSLEEKNHRIIIVPHEINKLEIKSIQSELKSIGLSTILYSNKKELSKSRILIVDKVGILADLYQYSDISYIGAGFSTGVHSVIEPAIYNNIVSFGPNYQIVDMAVDLINKNIGYLIKNKNDLIKTLSILDDKQKLKVDKSKIKKYIMSQKSASNNIIRYILNCA